MRPATKVIVIEAQVAHRMVNASIFGLPAEEAQKLHDFIEKASQDATELAAIYGLAENPVPFATASQARALVAASAMGQAQKEILYKFINQAVNAMRKQSEE